MVRFCVFKEGPCMVHRPMMLSLFFVALGVYGEQTCKKWSNKTKKNYEESKLEVVLEVGVTDGTKIKKIEWMKVRPKQVRIKKKDFGTKGGKTDKVRIKKSFWNKGR